MAIHILEGRNEDVAERDNLQDVSVPESACVDMYVCMYECMYAANVCGGICVLCVWSCVCTKRGEGFGERELTFSCFKCFRSFSSRYVLLDKTGVLKGFMIFLTATFWPVS